MTIRPIYDGPRVGIVGPLYCMEQFGFNGPMLSWCEWPDGRLSNCFVGDRHIGPVAFKRLREREQKRSIAGVVRRGAKS